MDVAKEEIVKTEELETRYERYKRICFHKRKSAGRTAAGRACACVLGIQQQAEAF